MTKDTFSVMREIKDMSAFLLTLFCEKRTSEKCRFCAPFRADICWFHMTNVMHKMCCHSFCCTVVLHVGIGLACICSKRHAGPRSLFLA